MSLQAVESARRSGSPRRARRRAQRPARRPLAPRAHDGTPADRNRDARGGASRRRPRAGAAGPQLARGRPVRARRRCPSPSRARRLRRPRRRRTTVVLLLVCADVARDPGGAGGQARRGTRARRARPRPRPARGRRERRRVLPDPPLHELAGGRTLRGMGGRSARVHRGEDQTLTRRTGLPRRHRHRVRGHRPRRRRTARDRDRRRRRFRHGSPRHELALDDRLGSRSMRDAR